MFQDLYSKTNKNTNEKNPLEDFFSR